MGGLKAAKPFASFLIDSGSHPLVRRPFIHRQKLAVSSHTVRERAENEPMRAEGFSIFRPSGLMQRITVSSHTVREYAENKVMRAQRFSLLRRSGLICLSGSHRKSSRRMLLCGCCFYYLPYSPLPRSSSNHVYRSLAARATSSATPMRFAQSAGRTVGGWSEGRVSKAPRHSSGSTRLAPSLRTRADHL